MYYIGIDNGASGGIAVIGEDGRVVRVEKAPPTEAELLGLLEGIVQGRGYPARAFAVLEHAQAFPKMGACSAFTYGQGYGAMKMALTAAAIPFDIVTPQKWQAALSCRTGGDKNVTKRRAEQLFPGIKVIHAIADALLMAEYCRRLKLGQLNQPSTKGVTNGKAERQGKEDGDLELEELASQTRDEWQRSEAQGQGGEAAQEGAGKRSAPRNGTGPRRRARSAV